MPKLIVYQCGLCGSEHLDESMVFGMVGEEGEVMTLVQRVSTYSPREYVCKVCVGVIRKGESE